MAISLKDIKKELCSHFGSIVTSEKLAESGGTKTIREAKHVGVLLARAAGYGNDDIAKAFGYENGHSVSNIFQRVSDLYKQDDNFAFNARSVAQKLSIDI